MNRLQQTYQVLEKIISHGNELLSTEPSHGMSIALAKQAIVLLKEEESHEVNLRKHYFSLRDILHLEGNTGYSKVEIHELAKKYIFPKLIEDPDNFIDGGKQQQELSVTWLSHKGWETFIEEFKNFASENFNTYL